MGEPVKDQDDIPWYIDQGFDTGEGSKVTEDEDNDTDDSATVVVPDTPEARDGLKEETGSVAAGSGSNLEEAQQDAAENQSFDADPSTDVGQIEKQEDLNQPLENPEGSTPEEVQQAAEKIAGSDRFRGSRTGRKAGALASAIERGQDNFDSLDLKRKNDKLQVVGRREKTIQKSRKNEESFLQRPEKFTDIGTLVNPTKGNPSATVGEELTTGGVDLIQKGQDFGESIGQKVPTRENAERFALTTARDISANLGIGTEEERQEFFTDAGSFLDAVPESPPTSNLEEGVARTSDVVETAETGFKQGDFSRREVIDAATVTPNESRRARENLISGVGTGGTAVTGLGIAATGAIPRASATTTQNVLGVDEEDREIAQSSDTGLVEGSGKGFTLTAQQAAENPDKFVGQEVGEEIGEAAVFGTLTGGAGLALSAAPTPEFEVTPSVGKSKGQTRGIPGVPSDRGPATTPGPGSLQPKPETETETLAGIQTGFEVETQAETDPTLQTEIVQNAQTGAPSLEENISRPEAVSQPQSDVVTRPESEIIGEIQTRTETRAEPEPDVITEPKVVTEPEVVSEPRLETEPEVVPEPDRTPGDFFDDSEEDEDNSLFKGFFGASKETQFQSSVGAELAGITAEKQPENFQDPTALRPVIENSNEENNRENLI